MSRMLETKLTVQNRRLGVIQPNGEFCIKASIYVEVIGIMKSPLPGAIISVEFPEMRKSGVLAKYNDD